MLKGFKTLLLGASLILSAVLADDTAKAFLAEHVEGSLVSLGTIVILLRAVTSTPVFNREPKE